MDRTVRGGQSRMSQATHFLLVIDVGVAADVDDDPFDGPALEAEWRGVVGRDGEPLSRPTETPVPASPN